MNRRRFVAGVVTMLAVPKMAFAGGPTIAVVCNPASGINSLSRAQLDAIFRLKTQQFPGGGRVTPINLPIDHVGRQEFDRVVLGLDPDEVERFWIDSKIRSGTGAPRHLPAPALARYIASESTAVGYLPLDEIGSGLRQVALVRDGRVVPS